VIGEIYCESLVIVFAISEIYNVVVDSHSLSEIAVDRWNKLYTEFKSVTLGLCRRLQIFHTPRVFWLFS